MKQNFTLLILSIFLQFHSLDSQAQISITAEDLPYPGLEVFTSNEALPDVLVGEVSEEAQIWNYTTLNSLSTQSVVFEEVAEDSIADVHYPNASMKNNLLSLLGGGSDLFPVDVGGATTYYSTDNQGNIEINGVFIDLGLDSDSLGFEEINMAGDPPDEFYSIGSFGDSFDSSSSYSFSFDIEVDTVPIPIPITISINTDRQTDIDAYGTLQFSHIDHEVVRYNEVNDVNLFVGVLGPFGIPLFSFVDTSFQSTAYRFYAKDQGYPVATVNMGEDENGTFPASIEYQALQGPEPVGFSYVVTCLNVAFTNTSSNSEEINATFWNFGDGNTSNSLDAVHNYEEMGTYTVTLEIERPNGETLSLSKEIEVGCTDVAIEDIPSVYHILYPNPAKDVLHFAFEPDALSKVERIHIYNALGQQIHFVNSLNEVVELNVEEWSNGVYFYSLYSPEYGMIAGNRFIVQH